MWPLRAHYFPFPLQCVIIPVLHSACWRGHIYGTSIYNKRACKRKGYRLTEESQSAGNGRGTTATGTESLSVTDNRTGKSYDFEISDGTVRAMDFRQIKVDEDDFGLMTYDPGYSKTA